MDVVIRCREHSIDIFGDTTSSTEVMTVSMSVGDAAFAPFVFEVEDFLEKDIAPHIIANATQMFATEYATALIEVEALKLAVDRISEASETWAKSMKGYDGNLGT
jgi:hypothetical protein